MRYFCALLCGDYQLLKQNINEKERDAKMKKTFKKIVAAATTAALAFVGTVTFNPADAKADTTTVIHIKAADGINNVAGWIAAEDGIGVTFAAQAENSNPALNWGDGNNPQFLAKNGDYYDFTITGDMVAPKGTNALQILVNCGEDSQYCCKYAIDADDSNGNVALFNSANEFWATLTPSGQWDGTISLSTIDPSAITAADVEALIDEIGDVTLDSASKIEAAEQAVADYLDVSDNNKTADISNYATLTAARETYDALKEADDKAKEEANEKAAGELTLYVEKPADWDSVSLWAWTDNGNLFKDWPGEALTACENNDGWYKATISVDGITNIIFSNPGGAQTVDITGLTAGTYWYTLVLNDGQDKFEVDTVVTEAPEGWEEEEKAELETEDPTDGDDETGDDETGDDEDTTSAWDDAKLKIHVKMPELENWDALGVYLFGSDENFGWSGSELSGAWPGAAMVLENDSETWYAFGGTFADGFYKLIVNNYVSDDEAAEGAIKCQIDPALDITDGEYWITIDLAEDGTYVATVMTEAPEDYDGTGLSDDQIAEDPTADDTDDATDDAADDDTTDDTTGANPASGSTDGLPVAGAMVVVMFSAAVVVASRKRRAA